jgi:glycosyltransferase involved in cell wall biosynthesis
MASNVQSSNGQARRVLVVVNHPLGGIRTYLLNNLPHIAKAGYAFTFLAPANDAFEEFKIDVRDWPGVEFVNVPVRNRKYSLCRAVWRELKSRRFNLIHSQGLRAGSEAGLANARFRIPHIMTLHDVIVPQNDIPGRLKGLKRFATEQITRRIDVIVPVSNDCAGNHLRHFRCWQRGPCRIEVIPNGVDLIPLLAHSDMTDAVPALRDQIGIGRDIVLAGFFGRFMPQKGFTVLLDALKLLAARGHQGKILLVATDDPYGYGREYRRVIEADPTLCEMVHLVATVPLIAALMSQVDFLVMPSLWEACPLLPMEAMILGVPVIGSDAIGLREVLSDTPSLAPEAGNAIALADAIEDAITGNYRRPAKDFMPVARKRFGIEQAVTKLHRLYSELAMGKNVASE